jgi:hypothetical protein
MTNNTITDNHASSGAGIYLYADGDVSSTKLTATLANNILAINQATSQGGAIFAVTGGTKGEITLKLTNNTISNNEAGLKAGGISLASFDTAKITAPLKNNIVWGNTIDISTEQYNSSTLSVTADHSIIGEVDVSAGGTYTNGGGNLNVNPLLKSNCHLIGASPAKDKGICGLKIALLEGVIYIRIAPYDDIDGDLRPGWGMTSGCDIGADEYRFPWIMFNPAFTKH